MNEEQLSDLLKLTTSRVDEHDRLLVRTLQEIGEAKDRLVVLERRVDELAEKVNKKKRIITLEKRLDQLESDVKESLTEVTEAVTFCAEGLKSLKKLSKQLLSLEQTESPS